jgi:hypothetical protein
VRRRCAVRARTLATTSCALGALALTGCTAGPPTDEKAIRLWTDNYYIVVTSEPSPPRALEQVQYTVVVRDKESRTPIDGGEGRIFATNEDRKNTHNGFEKADAPGTYRTTMFFATSGPWAMGIQFRRDSTQRLQRTNDWMQDVLAATEPGTEAPTSSPTTSSARPGQ